MPVGFASTEAAVTSVDFVLAEAWPPGKDPAPYLVSEKFDGVRAQWNGKQLYFRSGQTIAAPAWFLARLPAQPLDGELWLGRGQFDALSGIVRRIDAQDADWQRIRYMVFELPTTESSDTFAERAAKLQSIVEQNNWSQLVAVKQFYVSDNAALQQKLDEVVRAGGEGLMLHRADAPYQTGRADNVLFKLKPLADAEAVVMGYTAGKGKYRGLMGALRVKMPDGREFHIGTGFTDAVRANPPAIGATVTYTYRGFTSQGTPRFARYLRLRTRE